MSDRLAGGAFALAADPSLLVAKTRYRRRLQHRGGTAGRFCRIRAAPGGASRAVVFGLLERGIKRVHVANRTAERAHTLARQFGETVHPMAWGAIGEALPQAGLLVNTTSLGMHGQPALELDIGALPSQAIVADLVYVPLETPLLAAARAQGLRTADGLGMLLHQAVRGFELWFGHRPEVTPELRALVEADLRHP
jgi:shikimate dehydrogenase